MKRLLIGLLAFAIAGCEAPATPIAAPPTHTAISSAPLHVTESAPLRYGVLPHTMPYLTDVEQISQRAIIEAVTGATPISDYDLLVGYGVVDGWQQTPQQHRVALVLNPDKLTPDVRAVLARLLDPQRIIDSLNLPGMRGSSLEPISAIEARSRFANMGNPDGYLLTIVADPVPGMEQIADLFAESNINLNQLYRDDPRSEFAQLRVIRYVQDDERDLWINRVGAENVIGLYTLPISYRAREEFTVTYTADGWPLPPE